MHAPMMLTLLLLVLPLPNPPRDDAPQEERPGVRPIYIRSTYPERLTIRTILPPGTRVEKGQVVIEFVADTPRDRLADQQIATERAKADLENAKKTYEVALTNVEEYVEGIYPQELRAIEREIKLAEVELKRAKAALEDWKQLAGGNEENLRVLTAEVDYQRALAAHEQALDQKKVLEEYTFDKKVKSLKGQVEKARANVLRLEWEFLRAEEKQEASRRLLVTEANNIEVGDHVLAPADGVIEYDERDISPYSIVLEGALLFVFHPDKPIEIDVAHKLALPRDTKILLRLSESAQRLAPFLRQLLPTLESDDPPTDEAIEAVRKQAEAALDQPVTAEQIREALDEYERFRQSLEQRILGRGLK